MTTLLDWLEYMKRRVRWSWAFFPLKRIQIQSFIPSSALHIPLSISLTNSSTSCQDPQTFQARPIINTFEKPWNSFQKAARRNSKFPNPQNHPTTTHTLCKATHTRCIPRTSYCTSTTITPSSAPRTEPRHHHATWSIRRVRYQPQAKPA